MVNEMRAKPEGSLIPRFVYFYVINPNRLEYAASQLLVDIKVYYLFMDWFPPSSHHSAVSIKLRHGDRGGSQRQIGGPQAPV
jgi:hypothetical protein